MKSLHRIWLGTKSTRVGDDPDPLSARYASHQNCQNVLPIPENNEDKALNGQERQHRPWWTAAFQSSSLRNERQLYKLDRKSREQ